MTALQEVKTQIMNNRLSMEFPKATLILAYYQLHQENPGLHPDDWMHEDGGYCGWHALLIDAMFSRVTSMPDVVRYPVFLHTSLNALKDFHTDDEADYLTSGVTYLQEFMTAMGADGVRHALKAVEDLIAFHEGAPEDITDQLEAMHTAFAFVARFL